MTKKISTTVYLTKLQADRLDGLHADLGLPRAAMIRKGVDFAIRYFEIIADEQALVQARAEARVFDEMHVETGVGD